MDDLADVRGAALEGISRSVLDDVAGQEPNAIGNDVLDGLDLEAAIVSAADLMVECVMIHGTFSSQ